LHHFFAACSNKGDFVMPVDQRDAWVRAHLDDVFNGHNLGSLEKYMTEKSRLALAG
jgi:hypothetical protein